MSHFRMLCKTCHTLMAQCRCPSLDKATTFSATPCANCVTAAAETYAWDDSTATLDAEPLKAGTAPITSGL